MDANKRQELLNIGYSIQGTCGDCEHGQFHDNTFGVCAIHTYQHLKHSGDKRQLGIYKHGRCSKFKLGEQVAARLGLWAEFLK